MMLDLNNELLPNLPPYPTQDGHMSEGVYRAGEGCYDWRELTAPEEIPFFCDGAIVTEEEWNAACTALDRAGIPHHMICVKDGYLGIWMYYHRRMIEVVNRNGVISAVFIDTHAPHPSTPVLVRTVTETSETAFSAYLERLETAGSVKRYTKRVENNLTSEFTLSDGALLHAVYTGGDRTAHFAYDPVSVPIDAFGNDSHGEHGMEIYQYGLYYSGMRPGFHCDCGMCYLIRLPDNSLFVIDGGEKEQATAAATAELWSLMHRITDTPDGETIHISGYFSTHAHDDHMDMFSHLLRMHHEEIDLARVMFNFSDDSYVPLCPQTFVLINRILAYYPNVRYRKLHTGDIFTLAGVTFHVLQTHEDIIDESGKAFIGGFNDTSTVLKMSYAGKSFLILGDIDETAERMLLSHYTEKTLHADIVQCAHHLFNYLERIYQVIGAEYAMVPQRDVCRTNHDSQKYACVAKTVAEENFRFAANGTDGFRITENGTLENHMHLPVVGGVYDGTVL